MHFDIAYRDKKVFFTFSLQDYSLDLHNQVEVVGYFMKKGGLMLRISARDVDSLLTSLWFVKKEVVRDGGSMALPGDKIMRVLRSCILDECIYPPRATAVYNRLFPKI